MSFNTHQWQIKNSIQHLIDEHFPGQLKILFINDPGDGKGLYYRIVPIDESADAAKGTFGELTCYALINDSVYDPTNEWHLHCQKRKELMDRTARIVQCLEALQFDTNQRDFYINHVFRAPFFTHDELVFFDTCAPIDVFKKTRSTKSSTNGFMTVN